MGLNLQHAANCVINMDLPWNPAVLEQRIGRIYRLGQKNPIDVYNLVCEEGIESRIATLVDSKHAFFKGLFDGDTDTIQFGESSGFLSRIQKLIDPSAIAVVASRGDQAEAQADEGDEDIDLDDEVEDPIDEMIEAADEEEDLTPTTPEPGVNGHAAEPLGSAAMATELESPSTSDTTPTDVSPANAAAARTSSEAATEPTGSGSPSQRGRVGSSHPSTMGVRELFSQLQVRREPTTGKVVIEAPAEAAGALERPV